MLENMKMHLERDAREHEDALEVVEHPDVVDVVHDVVHHDDAVLRASVHLGPEASSGQCSKCC